MSRIERFLRLFSSKRTVEIYRWGLWKFFKCIYGVKRTCFSDLVSLGERYLSEDRNHKEDIKTYFLSMKGMAPKTISIALTPVRGFLLDNEIELPESFWRVLRRRRGGSGAITEDRKPTKKEMRKILGYMPISGRALYMMQLSSGMRIGELLKLRLGDVDVGSRPARVHIKAQHTKAKKSRITFLSAEAAEVFEEWLKFRPEYLERAIRKTWNIKKSRDDDRVFPFNMANAHQIWMAALRKAGLEERDERTGRTKLHPHSLRKFFISETKAVIPSEIVQYLVGHRTYMSSEYHRYTEEELAEYYLKGEHKVTIFSDESEVVRIKQEVEQQRQELQVLVNSLATQNLVLRERLEKLESSMREILPEVKKRVKQLVRVLISQQKQEDRSGS